MEDAMTTSPNSPQALPVVAAFTRDLTDTVEPEPAGPPVGAADAQADAATSGAGADETVTATHYDTDGVPVGEADLEADKRASGA
jgi:hypothetical protein